MGPLLVVLKVLVLYAVLASAVVTFFHWVAVLNGLDERRWR